MKRYGFIAPLTADVPLYILYSFAVFILPAHSPSLHSSDMWTLGKAQETLC
jgi:hypothetical protein